MTSSETSASPNALTITGGVARGRSRRICREGLWDRDLGKGGGSLVWSVSSVREGLARPQRRAAVEAISSLVAAMRTLKFALSASRACSSCTSACESRLIWSMTVVTGVLTGDRPRLGHSVGASSLTAFLDFFHGFSLYRSSRISYMTHSGDSDRSLRFNEVAFGATKWAVTEDSVGEELGGVSVGSSRVAQIPWEAFRGILQLLSTMIM